MTEWNTLSGRCPECFCTPHADGCQIGEMEQRIKELEARLDAVAAQVQLWKGGTQSAQDTMYAITHAVEQK